MKELKVELTEEEYQNLLDRADRNGRSMSEEALHLIMEDLKERRDEALLRANGTVIARE